MFIVLLALCLGTLANRVSPHQLPWTQNWTTRVHDAVISAGLQVVDLATVTKMVSRGSGFILDARSFASYGEGHLPGAFSLPASSAEQSFPEIEPMLAPDTEILVYCSGEQCEDSMDLGTFLLQQGFTNVSVFVGGYAEWSKAHPGGTP